VVAIDTDQTVSLINQAGCRLLGYSETQILGKNWFDHFLPEPVREHVRKAFVQLMSGIVEPVECVENNVLTRSGEERTIAWHNRLLKDKMGHITGTISSGDDITESKRAEATLLESEQRVRRLNEHILNMVMVLSHDIRGPLVAIASILKLMLRGVYGKLDQKPGKHRTRPLVPLRPPAGNRGGLPRESLNCWGPDGNGTRGAGPAAGYHRYRVGGTRG